MPHLIFICSFAIYIYLFVPFRCGPENFTAVITEFGLCYTFNSGKTRHRVLSVHRAGVDFALRLQLNVQQDQYYGFLRDSAGFKVMVHDQDEPAMINELGFAIQPGTHTFCSLKKIVVSTYLNVVFISALAPLRGGGHRKEFVTFY